MSNESNPSKYPIQTYKQKMYKVGFGPNVYGIISEDSLDRYSNKIGIEYHGERTIHYIEFPPS